MVCYHLKIFILGESALSTIITVEEDSGESSIDCPRKNPDRNVQSWSFPEPTEPIEPPLRDRSVNQSAFKRRRASETNVNLVPSARDVGGLEEMRQEILMTQLQNMKEEHELKMKLMNMEYEQKSAAFDAQIKADQAKEKFFTDQLIFTNRPPTFRIKRYVRLGRLQATTRAMRFHGHTIHSSMPKAWVILYMNNLLVLAGTRVWQDLILIPQLSVLCLEQKQGHPRRLSTNK